MSTTYIPSPVVAWAAQECAWQASGELSVAWMVEGWTYAYLNRHRLIERADVLQLGMLVEPRTNKAGFRTTPVLIRGNPVLPAGLVSHAIANLVETQPTHPVDHTMASEFFREYEEIHPFRDGNGRTGAILFNWVTGNLERPIYPPNLWGQNRG